MGFPRVRSGSTQKTGALVFRSEVTLKAFLLSLFWTISSYASNEACVLHLVVPQYPHLARSARLQGSVQVEVEVGTDGRVTSAAGSGAHKLLVQAAEQNVRQWIFSSPTRATTKF